MNTSTSSGSRVSTAVPTRRRPGPRPGLRKLGKQRRRWSPREHRILLENAGNFSIGTIVARVGRSAAACSDRLRREVGSGALARGQFTLQSAAAETGYHPGQLQRARRALGQGWLRTSKRGRWLITVEQIEAIVVWLKTDYWCVRLRLSECVRHRGADLAHRAHGLCGVCFHAVRAIARQIRLPISVGPLRVEVRRVIELAAPADQPRLVEYEAQLARGLMLLEDDLRQLARIVALADLVVRRRARGPAAGSRSRT